MDAKRSDDQYSDEEAERRMREALKRALNTPPKPQREIGGNSEHKTRKSEAALRKPRPK